MIHFNCPACNKSIQAPEKSEGLSGPCPSCKAKIAIPRASTLLPEFKNPGNGNGNGTDSSKEELREIVAGTASGKIIQPANPATPETGGANAMGVELATPAQPGSAPPTPVGLPPVEQYLKFKCPNCEKVIGFPLAQSGSPSVCPKCLTRIMIPERKGEASFIIGALAPMHKAVSPPHGPVTPVVRLHSIRRTATRLRVAVKELPWWKTALTALGCTAALVLACILIVGEFRRSQGAGSEKGLSEMAQADDAARNAKALNGEAKDDLPHVVQVKSSRAPEETPKEQGTRPRNDRIGTSESGSIGLREGTKVEPSPVKATTLLGLEPRTPTLKATDEDDQEPRHATPAPDPVTPATSSKPTAGVEHTDPVLKLLDKNHTQQQEPEAPSAAAPVPGIIGISPRGAATKAVSGGAAPAAPVVAREPIKPPTVCPDCQGVLFVRLPSCPPYVWDYKQPAPDPQMAVPYLPCPKCQKQLDLKTMVMAEAERMKLAPAHTGKWPSKLATQMECGETRFVSLAAQVSPSTARSVLQQLDKLTQFLQQNFRSALLTMTRPDRHELVILWDRTSYERLVDSLAAENPGEDWDLTRRTSGSISRNRCFFNAQRGQGTPPEHVAIFQFAHMLILEGTDGHSPDWLTEGFSSYCENVLLRKNLCYAFRYELNQVQFGLNWNGDIARYARAGQLQPWDRIFKLDLIGMKALDYLTCYSIVRFLTGDPVRFNTLLVGIRAGMDAQRAVEHAYGRPIGELQQMWAQWALTQR